MALQSRFNNLKYEHFKINFKGLIFEVKLLDNNAYFPNSDKNGRVEEFKISVTNGTNTEEYKFYNSQMEKQISDTINEYKNKLPFSQIVRILKSNALSMWGGYDNIRNETQFREKRIYHLLYSILNCFANDKNFYDTSLKDFCANYGYDYDSRTAEKIYYSCLEFKQKINNLNLTEKQNKYFDEIAANEEEQFNKDIIKAIEDAKNTK